MMKKFFKIMILVFIIPFKFSAHSLGLEANCTDSVNQLEDGFDVHGDSFLSQKNLALQSDPNLFLIIKSRKNAGMFSMFDNVIDLIHLYEQGHYRGIQVDFGTTGLYYDALHGSNWWSYYYKPVRYGKKLNSIIQENISPNLHEKTLQVLANNRHMVCDIIKKYFHMRTHVARKIRVFEKANFTNYFVISVHYRGTDKIIEAPLVPYEDVSQEVRNVMKTYGNKKYKIFLATDEQNFINYMKGLFGALICYNNDAIRSKDGKPIHFNKNFSPYKVGEDALIDCVLLSRGNFLIRCSSNLSRWSTYFNPNIPVMMLNERYNGRM